MFKVPVTLANIPAGAVATARCTLLAGSTSLGTFSSANIAPGTGVYNAMAIVNPTVSTQPQSYQCFLLVTNGVSYIDTATGTTASGTMTPGWTGTIVATGTIP